MTKQWEYEDFCGSLRVVDAAGDVVAELVNPNDEESARLMATAPELFDALRDAYEALDFLQNRMGTRINPPTLENASNAIAKVTGAK